jgi:hypothetical protein
MTKGLLALKALDQKAQMDFHQQSYPQAALRQNAP